MEIKYAIKMKLDSRQFTTGESSFKNVVQMERTDGGVSKMKLMVTEESGKAYKDIWRLKFDLNFEFFMQLRYGGRWGG